MYEVPDIELDGLYCVYCYSVFNCSGKDLMYIGQTNNIQLRHKKHIPLKKYGELKVDKYLKTHMWSLDILWIGFYPDVDATERYFIELFDTIQNGLNLTTGGGSYVPSAETKKKHSLSKKGILNPNHKKVYQYDLKGNYISMWDAVSLASQECNIDESCISNCARGAVKTGGGYIWRYYFEKSIQPPQYKKSKARCKKVAQYTLDGILVNTFESTSEASRVLFYDSGNISRAARGLVKSYNGFIWKYIE